MANELDNDPTIDKPDSVDQIGMLDEAPSNCFWVWNHRWGKWTDTETGSISRGGSTIGKYIYQERRCEKCNKVEMQTIRT